MLYLIIYLGIGVINMVISFIFLSWKNKTEGKVMKWNGFIVLYSAKLLIWPIDIAAMLWACTYLYKAIKENDQQKIINYDKEIAWIYEK